MRNRTWVLTINGEAVPIDDDYQPSPPASPTRPRLTGDQTLFILLSLASGILAGIGGMLLLLVNPPEWVFILLALLAVAAYVAGLILALACFQSWQWAMLAVAGCAAGAIMIAAEIHGGNHAAAFVAIVGLPALALVAAMRRIA